MKRFLIALAILAIGSVAGLGNALIGTSSKGVQGSDSTGMTCAPGTCGGLQFNVVTDFGAICDGVADDSAAFTSANNAMRADQSILAGTSATLIIPNGASCLLTTNGATGFFGIPNLTLVATGATMTITSGNKWTGDFDFSLGHSVQFATQAITAGQTCVTMQTPGDEVNYQPFFHGLPVWVTVAGEGVQNNGFPPNYTNWEFARVASTPAGQVCFTAPLKNSYPTNVVDLIQYGCSNFYCGGPPRLVRMATTWGGPFHMIGGTWHLANQFEAPKQIFIMDGVTMPDGAQQCYLPSVTGTVTYNNTSISFCHQENDKEVDTIIVNNSLIHIMDFQSSSITNLILNSGSTTTLAGTPLHTTCTNAEIDGVFFGTTYGGIPQTFAANNCNIGGVFCCQNNNFFIPGTFPDVWSYAGGGQFTNSRNVDNFGPPRWSSTGTVMYMRGANGLFADHPFTITGNTYVPNIAGQVGTWTMSTTFTGSLPPQLGGFNGWNVFPISNFTCVGCFGSAQALELSMSYAQNKPYGVYLNRTYTCANNLANVPGSLDINITDSYDSVFGNFVSMIVNVSQADTNPTDIGLGPRPFNANAGWFYKTVAGTEGFFGNGSNTINVLHAGARTILPASTSGAQAGDTLTAPGADAYISGSSGNNGMQGTFLITNGPAAQCPVVNVEIKTTQP